MARARNSGNGHLEEVLASLGQKMDSLAESQIVLTQAQATLAQAQATMIQTQAVFAAHARENDVRWTELRADIDQTNQLNAQRFARIEAMLIDHTRRLEAIEEAIREKIGFRMPKPGQPQG
jgi:hypothetical protein